MATSAASRLPKTAILVFARVPGCGTAKARIMEAWGKERADEVYRALLDEIAWTVRELPHHIAYLGHDDPGDLRRIFAKAESFVRQQGPTLPGRIAACCEAFFARGITRVCTIMSDCPYLETRTIERACELLGSGKNVVLGPSSDGGYYLCACDKKGTAILSAQGWGEPGMLKQTVETAQQHDLEVVFLPVLEEVDDIFGYLRWLDRAND
jgi:hypothetical protein